LTSVAGWFLSVFLNDNSFEISMDLILTSTCFLQLFEGHIISANLVGRLPERWRCDDPSCKANRGQTIRHAYIVRGPMTKRPAAAAAEEEEEEEEEEE
jgi:hypothetical protein